MFVCVSAPSRAAVGIVLCARGERVRAQPALPFHERARLASGDETKKKKNTIPIVAQTMKANHRGQCF